MTSIGLIDIGVTTLSVIKQASLTSLNTDGEQVILYRIALVRQDDGLFPSSVETHQIKYEPLAGSKLL